jgi:hypothetical protein
MLVNMMQRAGLGPRVIAHVMGPPVTAHQITDLMAKQRGAA